MGILLVMYLVAHKHTMSFYNNGSDFPSLGSPEFGTDHRNKRNLTKATESFRAFAMYDEKLVAHDLNLTILHEVEISKLSDNKSKSAILSVIDTFAKTTLKLPNSADIFLRVTFFVSPISYQPLSL